MKIQRTIFSIASLLLFSGLTVAQNSIMINDILTEAKRKLVPDRRTAVFDVNADVNGTVLTLRGDIQNASLKEKLLEFLKGKGDFQIVDSLTVLPHPNVGDHLYALVSVSVANIRTKPDHPAEMGTQALLGTPLKVLKQERGGWYLVQTPDDYLGWTDDMLKLLTKEEYEQWVEQPKVIITTEYSFVRISMDPKSQPVSDVVVGDILALTKDWGTHLEVMYPDGRTGYIPREHAEVYTTWLSRLNPTPENIVATAKRFFGVPYFWGGTSAKALDCSGFTKTVYFLNGILLPRDASQQAIVGDPVDTTSGYGKFQTGDLLFFGSRARENRPERVTHVGIYLGGGRFIHESGDVRINSFNPADPDFNGRRRDSLLKARRIIGAGEETGIRKLSQLPYYSGHAF